MRIVLFFMVLSVGAPANAKFGQTRDRISVTCAATLLAARIPPSRDTGRNIEALVNQVMVGSPAIDKFYWALDAARDQAWQKMVESPDPMTSWDKWSQYLQRPFFALLNSPYVNFISSWDSPIRHLKRLRNAYYRMGQQGSYKTTFTISESFFEQLRTGSIDGADLRRENSREDFAGIRRFIYKPTLDLTREVQLIASIHESERGPTLSVYLGPVVYH